MAGPITLAGLVLGLILAVAPAMAARPKIRVTTLTDVTDGLDALCSVREAIAFANTNTTSGAACGECGAGSASAPDTIDFSVTGTITAVAVLSERTELLMLCRPVIDRLRESF